MKSCCLLFLIWIGLPFSSIAQENQHNSTDMVIQCDKYVCSVGGTIWWKGYALSGNPLLTSSNDNMYVELYTAAGLLVAKERFPVLKGQSLGQMVLADTLSSGVYWLRFSTGNRSYVDIQNFAMTPITIYHLDDKNITLMKKRSADYRAPDPELVKLTLDTLTTNTGGYNSWALDISGLDVYHYSVSITDAGFPQNDTVTGKIPEGLAAVKADTSFLNWTGKAYKMNSKSAVKNKTVIAMLVKDSIAYKTWLIPVNSDGRFRLENLFFFGKENLLYQLNQAGGPAKDVNLIIDSLKVPPFKLPGGWLKKDSILSDDRLAGIPVPSGQIKLVQPNGKLLKEVEIKGRISPRKELDKAYTTGIFSEPAAYSFDLRNEKHPGDLGDYLRMHLFTQRGYSISEPPIYPNHPLLFYVNEELKTWDQIGDMSISDIAYIKAMESDFIGNDSFTKFVTGVGGFSLSGGVGSLGVPTQVTPMIIMIYTRKGKDIKKVQGLNQLILIGYTPIARFTRRDNEATLLWAPLVDANHIRLRFYNNGPARLFRLTLSGFCDNGKEIYYTTVLPKTN